MVDPALAPPAGPPRLRPGNLPSEDPAANVLSIQSRFARGGSDGLFDDLFGHGWYLVPRAAPPSTIGEGLDNDLVDTDGRYAARFDQPEADEVVVRPDFYAHAALPGVDAHDGTPTAFGRLVPPRTLVPA